jgi:hypothetical protein
LESAKCSTHSMKFHHNKNIPKNLEWLYTSVCQMVFCQKIPFNIKICYLNIIINITSNNFRIYRVIKTSLCTWFCNHQVHRDFLITLYNVICISKHDKLNNILISRSSLIFTYSLLSLLTCNQFFFSFIYTRNLSKICPLQNGFVAKLNLETLLYTINTNGYIRITELTVHVIFIHVVLSNET